MPLFTYRCTGCDETFETLVRSGETPECPKCQGTELEKQIGNTAPVSKLKSVVSSARKQAAKEGHFSNYSKSEMKGKL